MSKNYCIMQIWAEPEKTALPICNYSQILYQFLTFTQNSKRSPELHHFHFLYFCYIFIKGRPRDSVGLYRISAHVDSFARKFFFYFTLSFGNPHEISIFCANYSYLSELERERNFSFLLPSLTYRFLPRSRLKCIRRRGRRTGPLAL